MKRELENICRDCKRWQELDTSNKRSPAVYRVGKCPLLAEVGVVAGKYTNGNGGCEHWEGKR